MNPSYPQAALAPSAPRPNDRAVRRRSKTVTGFLGANFSTISTDARDLYRTGWFVLTCVVLIGIFGLYQRGPSLIPSFLVITVPALVCFRLWFRAETLGLPILPIILVQQAVVYAIPVFGYAGDMPDEYADIFFLSSALTGIFFVCLYAGWRMVYGRVRSKPSRLNLSLGEGKEANQKCLNLAYALLFASIAYHVLWRSGILAQLLPNGIISIVRTFSGAAAMLGALLGGIVVGKITEIGKRTLFWLFIITLACISLIDVLLSDASRVIIAAVVGMSLGKGKPPWVLLAVTFFSVGFLNQGKVDIRERYWEQGTNSTNLTFAELPDFFFDWLGTSTRLTLGGGEEDESAQEEEGASVFKRINNLQNTLFVVDAIQRHNKPLLTGDTYTLIPPLFIPRALWKGKPRAHKGQAILNVHFGRQRNEAATHRVYIAWGILPEAIGNYGVYMGPIILGLVLGASLAYLERVSLRKRVLSVEGMTLGGLLLITAGSYEMVASVLLTSTFQFLVAVGVAGFGLYLLFQGKTTDDEIETVNKARGASQIARDNGLPTQAMPAATRRMAPPTRPMSTGGLNAAQGLTPPNPGNTQFPLPHTAQMSGVSTVAINPSQHPKEEFVPVWTMAAPESAPITQAPAAINISGESLQNPSPLPSQAPHQLPPSPSTQHERPPQS